MTLNLDTPTSWDTTADQVQAGDRYRSLGRGFISRDVIAVDRLCNCQCRSRSIDPATGEPVHSERVVITCAGGFTAYLMPYSGVVLTDGY